MAARHAYGIPSKILPTTAELSGDDEEEIKRWIFFSGLYSAMIAVTLLVLSFRSYYFILSDNLYAHERSTTEPLEAEKEKDAEAPAPNETGENYTRQDVRFLIFDMVYHFCMALIVIYAVFNDFICKDTGLDFELYLPWLLEALISQVVCAFLSSKRHGKTRMWPLTLLSDLLGERFNTLRDIVALGVFVNVGTPLAWFCFTVSFVSMCLARCCIYETSTDVIQMRLHYWPVPTVPSDRPSHESLGAFVEEVVRDMEQTPASQSSAGPRDASTLLRQAAGGQDMSCVVKTLVDAMFSGSCAFKQKLVTIEQVPQALSGLLFTVLTFGLSRVVIFSTLHTIAQAVFLRTQRPYVVCLKARQGKPWQHLSDKDLDRARVCRYWRSLPCSLAAAEVLLSCHATEKVRLAAAATLGKEVESGNSCQEELRLLCKYALVKLVENLREAEFCRLAQYAGASIVDVQRDLCKGAANVKKWDMVAAILQHVRGANVNYCKLTANVLLSMIRKLTGPLEMTYLNLNDNKTLCSASDGVSAIEELLKKAPKLKELKLAATGITEVGQDRLRRAWGRRPVEGLMFEFPEKTGTNPGTFGRLSGLW